MTSISLSPTSGALASISIGFGDIAALVGAGRMVGNWVKANFMDGGLLNFLDKDVQEIVPRSLFLSHELERKYQKLEVFLDSRITTVNDKAAARLLKESPLSTFTWFMVLLLAALSAACPPEMAENAVAAFLLQRCSDSPGYEAIRRDMKRHLEAWASIGRVRGVQRRATDCWENLARQNSSNVDYHPPGSIPENDLKEVLLFLEWLAGNGNRDQVRVDRTFTTSSSDVAALAAVMAHIGIPSLYVRFEDKQYESSIVVVLDKKQISHAASSSPPTAKRRGMRINLALMHEAISLWPGDSVQNERLRKYFELGEAASQELTFLPGRSVQEVESIQTKQLLTGFRVPPVDRRALHQEDSTRGVLTFCDAFLIATSPAAKQAVSELYRGMGLSRQDSQRTMAAIHREDNTIDPNHLADIQCFLLGYWYTILKPMLDTDRMSVVEAFGGWTWNDLELIKLIKSKNATELQGAGERIVFVERSFLLKMVAFLFAGTSLETSDSIRPGCCGAHGRISVMDATLLGDTDTAMSICRYVLLDTDRTAFPSTEEKLMYPGTSKTLGSFTVSREESRQRGIDTFRSVPDLEDFTSVIEPDWDINQSTCNVAFRRQGRLIKQVSPAEIYDSILAASPPIIHQEDPMNEFEHPAQGHMAFKLYPPSSNKIQVAFTCPQLKTIGNATHGGPIAQAQQIELKQFDGGSYPTWLIEDSDTDLPLRPPPNVFSPTMPSSRHGRFLPSQYRRQPAGFVAPKLSQLGLLYVDAGGLPKARTCITALCYDKSLDDAEPKELNYDVWSRPKGASEQAIIINQGIMRVVVV